VFRKKNVILCSLFDCESNSKGKCQRKEICINKEGKCCLFHIWIAPTGEVWQGDLNSGAC